MSEFTRRDLFKTATATAAGGLATEVGAATSPSIGARKHDTLFTNNHIEVYTDRWSAAAGDAVSIHVSTISKRFHLQIERIGVKPTVVWRREDFPGTFYPTPDDAWEKGCRWPAAIKIKVPDDWMSGYYQITAMTEGASYPAFVVIRTQKPTAKMLMVLATNTYNAYNSYGGASAYIKKSTGASSGITGTTGEPRTSFQRPLMPEFLRRSNIPYFTPAGFSAWEWTMTLWLEQNGYAVDFAINSDLEFHPELLSGYRLMLSVGHDEYWSWGMRDTVESFVSGGGNVCFFSGNLMWQVRFEDQGNVMVCYKDDRRNDPMFKQGKKQFATGCWTSHDIGRPVTQLTGLSPVYALFHRFRDGVPRGPGGYLIYRPEHWIFEGTGLSYGDCFGAPNKIVHYEVDGCPIRIENGLPYPASFYDGPKSLQILGMIPATLGNASADGSGAAGIAKDLFGAANPEALAYVSANRGHAVMGIYQNSGTVFCGGTTDWTNGLAGIDTTWGDGPANADPVVERATRNLLDRLSK